MVGQARLKDIVNKSTLATFPKVSLIIGEAGCGKHTFADYIALHFNCSCQDITEDFKERLSNVDGSFYAEPVFYLIDLDKLTELEQNKLLKILEEPFINLYILCITSRITAVLETVKNRCFQFYFDQYSEEELLPFVPVIANVDTSLLVKICRTPGRLISVNTRNFDELVELCNNIVKKIGIAPFYNVLSIVDKINFADYYDKFDFKLFIDTLIYICESTYTETLDEKYLDLYKVIDSKLVALLDSRIDKEIFVKNLLVDLWLEANKNDRD